MKRYALCIGNDNYDILSKLSCAVADATSVAEKLSVLGFDVDIAMDLNCSELAQTIVRIQDKIEEYDAVLLYYAGHGFQINGENLLVPVEFNDREDPHTAKYRAFPVNDLLNLLESSIKKTKVIILDACRSIIGVRGSGYDFAPMVAPQGSIIAFATSPGHTAKEDHGHGLYTKYLLEHLDEPRISIETMFKRVRTDLATETNGAQIPWEHTSLIGDFQLNPNTIYGGVNYSSDALADREYVFDRDSKAAPIVSGLKTLSWGPQKTAMSQIRDINFQTVRADDLFVLGRNIYQAACGCCYDSQGFIDNLTSYSYIPDEAKGHLLNGMAFEIYYDHEGDLRRNLKWDYADAVISLLETEPYLSSCEFIATRLLNEDRRVFYVPGQNEKIKVTVKVVEVYEGTAVEDIVYEGRSFYFNVYSNEKPDVSDCYDATGKAAFEAGLRKKMAVMTGYLKVTYDGSEVTNKTKLLLPFNGYNLYPTEEE